MLFIHSNAYYISIPNKIEEVAVHAKDHYKDENGAILEIPPSDDRLYHYGDLYIETPFSKYIFRGVDSAYSYPAKIYRLINEQKFQYLIDIDLDAICGDNRFRAKGGLEIVSKAQTINLQAEDYEELPF